MPVTVREKFQSRDSTTGDGAQVELAYIIEGTDDDVVAKTAMESDSPGSHDGLTRESVHVEPIGPGLWDGRARYSRPDAQSPSTGGSSFSFDTGGGTQHITQSIQTIQTHPVATAPDFGGAIGVTHDAVEGVDITIPVYQFSETHYLPDAAVTNAYRGTLFRLTGKVNDAAFKGTAAGECLFLGASGAKRGQGDWEIAFSFAASPNATGLTVGSIVGIDKKGWEYMWVRYADGEDANAKAIVKKPVSVYIEKVYEEADFAGLGIGT